jgi:hypothetical protein
MTGRRCLTSVRNVSHVPGTIRLRSIRLTQRDCQSTVTELSSNGHSAARWLAPNSFRYDGGVLLRNG